MKTFEDIQENDSLVVEVGNSTIDCYCAVKLGPFKDYYQIFVRTPSAMAFPPFWISAHRDANIYNAAVKFEYPNMKVKIYCEGSMSGKTLKTIKDRWPDVVIDEGDGKIVRPEPNEYEEEEEEETAPKRRVKRSPQNVIDANLASLCQQMIVSLGRGIKLSKIEPDKQGRNTKIGPVEREQKDSAKELIKSFKFKYIKERKDGDKFYLLFRQ